MRAAPAASRGPHGARLPLPLRADRHPGGLLLQRLAADGVLERLHARLVPPAPRQRAAVPGRAQQPGGGRSGDRPRRPARHARGPGAGPLPSSAASGPPRHLLYLPVIIPEVVLGAALVTFFGAVELRLSLATVVIAHVVFSVSYVAIVVRARLAGLDPALRGGGARPRRRPLRDLPAGDAAARRARASWPAPCSSSPSRSTTTSSPPSSPGWGPRRCRSTSTRCSRSA